MKFRGCLIRSNESLSGQCALLGFAWLSLTLLIGACSGTTSGNPFEKSGSPPSEFLVSIRLGAFAPANPEDYASQARMCVESIRLYNEANLEILNAPIYRAVEINDLGTVLAQAQSPSMDTVHHLTLRLNPVTLGRTGQRATCSDLDRSIEFYNSQGGPFYSVEPHVLTFMRSNGRTFNPVWESLSVDLNMEPLMRRLASVEASDQIGKAIQDLDGILSFEVVSTQSPAKMTVTPASVEQR